MKGLQVRSGLLEVTWGTSGWQWLPLAAARSLFPPTILGFSHPTVTSAATLSKRSFDIRGPGRPTEASNRVASAAPHGRSWHSTPAAVAVRTGWDPQSGQISTHLQTPSHGRGRHRLTAGGDRPCYSFSQKSYPCAVASPLRDASDGQKKPQL